MCLCTGMLYDPNAHPKTEEKKEPDSKSFQRLKSIKESLFLRKKKME
jgi:hypothetical protein